MRSRAAFTLIELLVVISIIALLIALLVPAIKQAKHITKITMCGSNMHQIAVAMTTYAGDASGAYPQIGTINEQSSAGCWANWCSYGPVHGGEGVGYGALIKGDYLTVEMTLCPGRDFVSEDWPAEDVYRFLEDPDVPNGDGPAIDSDGVKYPGRVTYHMRGWAGLDGDGHQSEWVVPDERWAIASDFILTDMNAFAGHDGSGLNVAYADGSRGFVAGDTIPDGTHDLWEYMRLLRMANGGGNLNVDGHIELYQYFDSQ